MHEQRKVGYFLGCVEKIFEPPKNEKNDTNIANNVKYMKINKYQIFFYLIIQKKNVEMSMNCKSNTLQVLVVYQAIALMQVFIKILNEARMMIEEIGEATNTVSLLEHIIIQGPELIKCEGRCTT